MKLKDIFSLEERYDKRRKRIKSRDITLSTNVHLVKAMVFPVVMYRYESWTIKNAEHRRIDAFELQCWRRLLRIPWRARGLNHPILKESNPQYSLKGLILKLKLQYFGHLMQRVDSLEKTLMLGMIEGRGKWGNRGGEVGQHHGFTGFEFKQGLRDGEGQGSLACCCPWGHKESDMTERLNNNSLLRVGAALTSHGEIFSWTALLALQCRTATVHSAQSGDAPGQYCETS